MFQFLKRKRTAFEQSEPVRLQADNIPQHVAIIMDGNGRWAKSRGLPRAAGHRAGMSAVKRATIAAAEIGIQVLTLYAFSTENWKRPQEEVDFLMSLPQEFLEKELDELNANNVQLRMMGWKEGLPAHTLSAIETAIERTKNNTGLILNFALNYGSRHEIVSAIRQIAQEIGQGQVNAADIDDDMVSNRLLTSGLPDPDLMIRTSGEIRISNFMLWQIAYSELWFTDIYWPEFTKEHLLQAISEYQRRARRYGGL
jgi:undecaprenyl diphosphate synthase